MELASTIIPQGDGEETAPTLSQLCHQLTGAPPSSPNLSQVDLMIYWHRKDLA